PKSLRALGGRGVEIGDKCVAELHTQGSSGHLATCTGANVLPRPKNSLHHSHHCNGANAELLLAAGAAARKHQRAPEANKEFVQLLVPSATPAGGLGEAADCGQRGVLVNVGQYGAQEPIYRFWSAAGRPLWCLISFDAGEQLAQLVDVTVGEGAEHGVAIGEEVVHGTRRGARALRHAMHGDTAAAFLHQDLRCGVQDGVYPSLPAFLARRARKLRTRVCRWPCGGLAGTLTRSSAPR